MKAKTASEAKTLEHIPNIGRALANILNAIGITKPSQLKGKDGIKLYLKLFKVTGIGPDRGGILPLKEKSH